jgi:hypothetical protein
MSDQSQTESGRVKVRRGVRKGEERSDRHDRTRCPSIQRKKFFHPTATRDSKPNPTQIEETVKNTEERIFRCGNKMSNKNPKPRKTKVEKGRLPREQCLETERRYENKVFDSANVQGETAAAVRSVSPKSAAHCLGFLTKQLLHAADMPLSGLWYPACRRSQ